MQLSALIASEWYMRNDFFPGWARPYEFAAQLLADQKRYEEARDMARCAEGGRAMQPNHNYFELPASTSSPPPVLLLHAPRMSGSICLNCAECCRAPVHLVVIISFLIHLPSSIGCTNLFHLPSAALWPAGWLCVSLGGP